MTQQILAATPLISALLQLLRLTALVLDHASCLSHQPAYQLYIDVCCVTPRSNYSSPHSLCANTAIVQGESEEHERREQLNLHKYNSHVATCPIQAVSAPPVSDCFSYLVIANAEQARQPPDLVISKDKITDSLHNRMRLPI